MQGCVRCHCTLSSKEFDLVNEGRRGRAGMEASTLCCRNDAAKATCCVQWGGGYLGLLVEFQMIPSTGILRSAVRISSGPPAVCGMDAPCGRGQRAIMRSPRGEVATKGRGRCPAIPCSARADAIYIPSCKIKKKMSRAQEPWQTHAVIVVG
eukprot:714833-Amphidinium_carterae.1